MTERVKVKEEPKKGAAAAPGRELHDALEDTFPASDPLAMTQPMKPGKPDDAAARTPKI